MRLTRMNTTPRYHSHFALVARPQSKMRNGMEEVVGSIPTRSTKSLTILVSAWSRLCSPALLLSREPQIHRHTQKNNHEPGNRIA